MHRVFFFSGYRLKLFYWRRSRLQGVLTFEPSEEGFAQFESYLKATKSEPARFLVDLIEEDYFPKHLAHCTGASRRALLNRALTQQFRDEPYTMATYQGVTRHDGAKEDVFLLSALTNSGIMDPWLSRIRDAGVALAGISSVPHVVPRMLPRLHIKRRHVLAITQEVGTAFRQTFFEDKRLVFSRVAKVPRGALDDNNSLAYACLITAEIEQTIRYLDLQRRISPESLEVHCLVPPIHKKVLGQAFARAHEAVSVKVHSLDRFLPHMGLGGELADGLMAWYCAKLPLSEQHYEQPEDITRFDDYKGTQRLTWSAAVVLVGATLLSIVFGFQAHQAEQESNRLTRFSQQLQQQYDVKFGAVLSELSIAEQIRDAVLLAERVREKSNITPQDFYIQLSQVMGLSEFSSVKINSIEWRKGLGAESEFDDLLALKYAEDSNYDPFMEDPGDTAGVEGVAEVSIGVISGQFIITQDSSYRRIVSLANDLVAAIEAHDRVDRVDVLTLPVEHRFHKEFADEVSQEASRKGGLSIDGAFKFRIIMRGPVNA